MATETTIKCDRCDKEVVGNYIVVVYHTQAGVGGTTENNPYEQGERQYHVACFDELREPLNAPAPPEPISDTDTTGE